MQLETINKLYLELSQVATAKTAQELRLERFNNSLIDRMNYFAGAIVDMHTGENKDSAIRSAYEFLNLKVPEELEAPNE